MRITDLSGGCMPTEVQELLLKAALLETDEAVAAWRKWHAAVGLDHLDMGSFRLLPLVYQNLRKLGYADPVMPTLRGVHRRAWCETRLLFGRLAPVVRTLEDNGVPTLLLKGVPLALLHYQDPGLRPMQDLDILVPEEHAGKSIRLFESQGWRNQTTADFRFSERDTCFRHSISYKNSDGREFDLHWHVLFLATFAGADKRFWEASVPLEFEGIRTRTLCATDHLVQACVHGVLWNQVPPMRWVADATVIMRACEIDWGRVVRLAAELRISMPLRDGLEYLAGRFSAGVPEHVLLALRRIPVTRGETLEYARLRDPLIELDAKATVHAVCARYLRGMRGRNPFTKLVNVPRFLRFYWKKGSVVAVWVEACRWLLWRVGLAPCPSKTATAG